MSHWYTEVEELAPFLSQVGLALQNCKDHPKLFAEPEKQTELLKSLGFRLLSIDEANKL